MKYILVRFQITFGGKMVCTCMLGGILAPNPKAGNNLSLNKQKKNYNTN